MIRRAIDDESGYSLVEVVAAIMILSIAIIPMVGMFDAGLRASVVGSNYDKGRALASEELAEIQALPFSRSSTPAADSVVEIYPPSNGPAPPAGVTRSPVPCTPSVPTGFDCRVETKYVLQDGSNIAVPPGIVATSMIQVTVTVRWDNNAKSYSTTGLISKGAE